MQPTIEALTFQDGVNDDCLHDAPDAYASEFALRKGPGVGELPLFLLASPLPSPSLFEDDDEKINSQHKP